MTWDEMRKKYPAPEFPEDMSEERLKEYISDCFDCYEAEGFSKLFWSQGGDYTEYQGKTFEVVGRAPNCDADHPDGIELSCQPMWTIRFEDGHEMPAYPDEIIPSVMHSSGCPLDILPQEFRDHLETDESREEIKTMTDVKIVVEGGCVVNVYASKENTVMVEVIDCDVQDPEVLDELDEQVRQLENQAANAQMFRVY